jgi:tetratricopeptide (TPR) repeat protein
VKAYDTYLAMHGKATSEIFELRGLLQQKLGNYAGAIDDFTRSLAVKTEPRTLATRGWAYLVNEVPRLALHDFQEVLQRDPDNTDALTGRGFARAKLGNHALAVTDASEAVRRAPRDPRTIYNAARVYAQSLTVLNADKGPRTLAMAETRISYQDQAVNLLRNSVELLPARDRSGFWHEQVQKDPALAPLRRTKEYKDLASMYEGSEKR